MEDGDSNGEVNGDANGGYPSFFKFIKGKDPTLVDIINYEETYKKSDEEITVKSFLVVSNIWDIVSIFNY